MSKALSVSPETLDLPKPITTECSVDVQIANNSSTHLAFKFRVPNTALCHVKPPKGILPPGEQLKVYLRFYPGAEASGKEGISKVMIQAVPVGAPNLSESEFKNVFVTDKDKIEKHMLAVRYGEENAVEDSVLLKTAVQSPAKETAAAESDVVKSAASVEPAVPVEPVAEPPATEPSEDVKALKTEIEKLKSDNLTLQSQKASLQSKVEELQKKVDAGFSVDRADRRSWIMLAAAILVLLSVIIYSLNRPSSIQHKEI